MLDDSVNNERLYYENRWIELLEVAHFYKMLALEQFHTDKTASLAIIQIARKTCANEYPEFEHFMSVVFCF